MGKAVRRSTVGDVPKALERRGPKRLEECAIKSKKTVEERRDPVYPLVRSVV